jgi:hypothetical protein
MFVSNFRFQNLVKRIHHSIVTAASVIRIAMAIIAAIVMIGVEPTTIVVVVVIKAATIIIL